jgi:hypothetical protein
MGNQIYLAGLKVLRGVNQDMPEELTGAIAPCFVAAPDYEAAVRSGVAKLSEMGFEFVDVVGDVSEVPAEDWDDYVSQAWPEFAATLPRQADLGGILDAGGVFFGPFAGFDD